ncbi:MAG: phosphomannomutase/phosphoglucomutase [Lysobacter sp.]|nr:phosphomannomutase/phosphoglucomutase [Lysobacter sp.]
MKDRTRQQIVQIRPALLPIAGLCLVLALVMGWSGLSQFMYDQRREELELTRDNGMQLVHQAMLRQQKQLTGALEQPSVQAALATGDLAAAARAISTGWPNVSLVQVHRADLETAYADAEKGGFGRLGVLESALAENRVRSWVVSSKGKPQLSLAAPVKQGDRVIGVAYAQLPLSELTSGLDTLGLSSDSYLALRQGGASIWERGEMDYAGGAERMAREVSDSGLRVVAATSTPPAALAGLGAIPAMVAAVLLLLLAYVAWRLRRVQPGSGGGEIDDSPTLMESVASQEGAAPAALPPPIEVREAPKAAKILIERSIFRAYDIRGVVGQTLDAGVAELIGHAIGSLMREQDLSDIVVGRDGRLSGPTMVEGLVAGLRKAGVNVIDIGMVPTPVVYFGAYHLRTGCCVSVTGSHNPPDYNGFKIVVGGETLSGDAITDLHARIAENRLHQAHTQGTHSERDISADYVQRIASDVQLGRRLKVVVDAGNGAAGEIGPRVLEAIGADVEELYCEIDGTFPNHHPDPSEPHNLVDLINMVQRLDADLGIAFDGDGDRLGVVTRDGENIFADRLLMLFAADVLERNPGAMIVYDVKCTGRLAPHILRHGGSPLMWKTGHSLIKAKMRETGAELAGEMSGHFFFAERWYGFDDGIYSAARLLEILAASPEFPDDVLHALPKGISTPELKIEMDDIDPHAFVERFRENAQFEGGRASTIDGLRVDWPDGWGLVRASNTTPILVLRFEADDRDALLRIQAAFRTRLLQLKPDMVLPF